MHDLVQFGRDAGLNSRCQLRRHFGCNVLAFAAFPFGLGTLQELDHSCFQKSRFRKTAYGT